MAYEYGMTLRELDSLNPQIVEGLKIGQEIRVKKQEIREVLPEKDSLFNYYKVLPAEGYYRIEKKTRGQPKRFRFAESEPKRDGASGGDDITNSRFVKRQTKN